MNYLLDTGVVCEPMIAKPDPGVVTWLSQLKEERAFISVVTIAELRHRIASVGVSTIRQRLESWLKNDLLERFAGRICPIDDEVAQKCGELSARSEAFCWPFELRDALIAATAEIHDLTLVTRNPVGFDRILRSVFTPWTPTEIVPRTPKQALRRETLPKQFSNAIAMELRHGDEQS